MFRRRKKLYFKNTVSKFPTIIFIVSVIIGAFFLFKIISTLVTEKETLSPIEIKTEIQSRIDTPSVSKPVVQKPAETPVVKKPTEAPVVKPSPEKIPAAAPSAEFYTVQVATFADMVRTNNLAKKLKEGKFSPVYVKTRGKLFEVCVGNFSNPQEGQEVLLKIRKDFRDAFVRKIQSPFEEK
jgi:cell division septation protein DedD